jgi:hypothetical protein
LNHFFIQNGKIHITCKSNRTPSYKSLNKNYYRHKELISVSERGNSIWNTRETNSLGQKSMGIDVGRE